MSGKKCCIFVPTVMSLLATCLSFNLNARESVYFAAKHWPHCTCSVSYYPCLDTKDNNFIT